MIIVKAYSMNIKHNDRKIKFISRGKGDRSFHPVYIRFIGSKILPFISIFK